MKRTGFTLIELLVVIAVIAVLAAILFPVFTRAKQAAIQSTCASNLEQLGRAIQLYMADNGDKYPWITGAYVWEPGYADKTRNLCQVLGTGAPWGNVDCPKYVKNTNVFRCPADTGCTIAAVNKVYKQAGTSYSFYGIHPEWLEYDSNNAPIPGPVPPEGFENRIGQKYIWLGGLPSGVAKKPSKLIAMFEVWYWHSPERDSYEHGIAMRKITGLMNVGYADGHVGLLRYRDWYLQSQQDYVWDSGIMARTR